ncbi:hypothetical protein B0H14DRAFT_1178111 [Mycena olivaceomarginata]|nr:hypothetical protein B0H14DRAFT_1178111 [Mycena olivaceomarginata]
MWCVPQISLHPIAPRLGSPTIQHIKGWKGSQKLPSSLQPSCSLLVLRLNAATPVSVLELNSSAPSVAKMSSAANSSGSSPNAFACRGPGRRQARPEHPSRGPVRRLRGHPRLRPRAHDLQRQYRGPDNSPQRGRIHSLRLREHRHRQYLFCRSYLLLLLPELDMLFREAATDYRIVYFKFVSQYNDVFCSSR